MNVGLRVWTNMISWIITVPNHLKTQKICEKAVGKFPRALKEVPDHFKTQEMYEGAVEKASWVLIYVPDLYKTQEMCDKAVEADPLAHAS